MVYCNSRRKEDDDEEKRHPDRSVFRVDWRAGGSGDGGRDAAL